MRIIVPVTLALIPTVVAGWSLLPSWYGFDRPLLLSPSEILREQQALVNRMGIKQSSPRYEITDDEKKFQVAVDVPGVKMEDIHVTLERDNALLSISGIREASGESYKFTSKFSQSFSLDPTVITDELTANLKDGVLIVSAPKDMKRLEQSVRKIPILEHKGESTPAIEENRGKEVKVEQQTTIEETKGQEVKVEQK